MKKELARMSHPARLSASQIVARNLQGRPAKRDINGQTHCRVSHPPTVDFLAKVATRLGIELEYVDAGGKRRRISRESLEAMVKLWDISWTRDSDLQIVLESLGYAECVQRLEPVQVAWIGTRACVQLRIPSANVDRAASCKLFLEDGRCRSLDWDLSQAPIVGRVACRGREFVQKRLPLPDLPMGYHTLEIELNGRLSTSLLISAPTEGYSPPDKERRWGLFLPMYAAQSKLSQGAGTFAEWRILADQVASLGGGVVGTLPLLATFLDKPLCDPSPYSPVSRLFWNEFYVDLNAAPELQRCPAARKLLASTRLAHALAEAPSRSSEYVHYREEFKFRRRALQLLADEFFTRPGARRSNLDTLLKERPELLMYSRFRGASERAGTPWRQWKPRLREGGLQPEDYAQSDVEYHLYAQLLAQEQLGSLVRHCRSRKVEFFLDLPVGVHPDGYDSWRFRHLFAAPASTGCPPDLVFTKGQDWGFCPLHPSRLRESHYAYLIDYLRLQMAHTGLLRIDHVMGLHRLYWIPPGLAADQGAYVRYPAEEWHAIFNLESHRNKTVLAGENLGTVPPEVNASMERHHLRQMYVAQYEQRPDARKPLREPPEQCLASVNTHDMPTFAAYWSSADIHDRAALGLIPASQVADQLRQRALLKLTLSRFLRRAGFLQPASHKRAPEHEPEADEVHAGLVQWLASGVAETLLINFEDLVGELRPQNVPGTGNERPNWRRKAKVTLEELFSRPEITRLLKSLSHLRRQPG